MPKYIAIPCMMLLLQTVVVCAQVRPTEDDVFALEARALMGDRRAVATLFSLYPASDGAVTEDIDIVLGRVAQAHPVLFLEELKAHRPALECSNVSNLGEEFVDQFDKQLLELRARRDALASVEDGSVAEQRVSCLRQLDDAIRVVAQSRDSEGR